MNNIQITEQEQQNQYEVKTITFRDLAEEIGVDDLDTPYVYDITDANYEILSYDIETKQEVWKPLSAFVVKAPVTEHYQLNTLHGTKDHKVLFNGEYVRLQDHPAAELVKSPIQVVDCEVQDTHCYISEGQVNHNTTTPGGNAIPFHSSVRLKLTGGQQIKDKDDEVIGINVTAKTIKNKVARPARDVAFQIMFGVGITEDEQTFDVMRAWCDEHKEEGYCLTDNNKRVSVEGAGAWKTFTVTDMNTGEEERNIKFYKADFGDKILRNAELQDYVSALYDAVYIKTGKDHREAVEPLEEDETGTVIETATANDE